MWWGEAMARRACSTCAPRGLRVLTASCTCLHTRLHAGPDQPRHQQWQPPGVTQQLAAGRGPGLCGAAAPGATAARVQPRPGPGPGPGHRGAGAWRRLRRAVGQVRGGGGRGWRRGCPQTWVCRPAVQKQAAKRHAEKCLKCTTGTAGLRLDLLLHSLHATLRRPPRPPGPPGSQGSGLGLGSGALPEAEEQQQPGSSSSNPSSTRDLGAAAAGGAGSGAVPAASSSGGSGGGLLAAAEVAAALQRLGSTDSATATSGDLDQGGPLAPRPGGSTGGAGTPAPTPASSATPPLPQGQQQGGGGGSIPVLRRISLGTTEAAPAFGAFRCAHVQDEWGRDGGRHGGGLGASTAVEAVLPHPGQCCMD